MTAVGTALMTAVGAVLIVTVLTMTTMTDHLVDPKFGAVGNYQFMRLLEKTEGRIQRQYPE